MAKTQVRPTSKGQVTLPISVRRKLNVGSDTLLDVTIENENIVLRPIHLGEIEDAARLYSTQEIDEFLEIDQISPENAAFFKNLLKKA